MNPTTGLTVNEARGGGTISREDARRWSFVAAVVVLGLAARAVGAQPPDGGQFQVNANTGGSQYYPAVSPVDGGFVVVWQSPESSGTDSDDLSIQARLFAEDGSPLGHDFQVNDYTTGRQYVPVVGSDGAGGFIVAWQSHGSHGTDGDGRSVQARRYSADGRPFGPAFQVNQYTTGHQAQIAVISDGSGGFVIVWGSAGSSGTDTDGSSVQARCFPAGELPTAELQVNAYTLDEQFLPAVGSTGADGFVIAWASDGSPDSDTSGLSVRARRFGADCTPVASEFQVNVHTTGDQHDPRVAPDGQGGFVVAWSSEGGSGTDTDGLSVQARRFTGNGTPIGDQFQVNAYTSGGQHRPAIGPDPEGGFVVVWTSNGSSGSDDDLTSAQLRRYGADGVPLSAEVQVNTFTAGHQGGAVAGRDSRGGLVVAWSSDGSSGTDTDDWSIQAQRFLPTEIFSDGFETGDTSAWSHAVP